MSDVHEARRSIDDGHGPEERAARPDPAAANAALNELQHRHQIIAAELARLSAILDATGWTAIDPPPDGSSAPVAAYETAPLPAMGWERGALRRAGGAQPESQRVIHLGTQRNWSDPRRRSLAVGVSAGAVGAVVAAALLFLVVGPRLAQRDTGFSNTVVGAASEAAAQTPAPAPAAPLPQEAPTVAAAPTSGALDAILARARSVPDLGQESAALVRRLPALSALTGSARAEEAADIYGLAVTAARTDTSGVAQDIVTALEPEVTMDAALTLASRRPDVVGAGVAPLMDELAVLPTLPAERQQVQAQALMDAVAAGVASETIAGPFCNTIAKPLMDYGAEMPG